MILLPWLLLLSTLCVRVLLARRLRAGWYVDLLSVGPWLVYYAHNGDWQLMAVPVVFGWLDVQALRRWWRKEGR